MQITVNRINQANATVSALVPNSTLELKIDEVAKEAGKTIQVPGFRKGKVPSSVIKSRYADRLQDDVNSQILREMFDKALSELQVLKDDIIGEPQVSKFDKDNDELSIEIKVSMKPGINLEGFEKSIPQVKEAEVTDKEVDERIEALAKSKAPSVEAKANKKLAEGDIAVIDFEGSVDGEPIEGGKESNFSLTIGSKTFIEGFEEQLIGMKAGEARTIKATFPEDYRSEKIAGKEATFEVKLNKIETKETPSIDDELAKTLLPNEKDATLALLKERVKEQIKSEKMSKIYNEELKPKILEALATEYELDLPESVVEQEIELNFRSTVGKMSPAEIDELKTNADKLKDVRESHRESAERSVKVTFLIDALAKENGIDISDNELVQTIYYEAMMQGQEPKQMFNYYKESGLLPAVKMAMIEDRLLSYLLDKRLKGEI